MKKILIGLLFLAVAFAACSQDVIYRDTATVQWDAPAETLLPGESIEFNVYLWDMAGGDPTLQPVTSLLFISRVAGLELAIDMTILLRYDYAVAVESVFIGADLVEVTGGVAYSTVNTDVDPITHPSGRFTYVPILGQPSKSQNLRDSGT